MLGIHYNGGRERDYNQFATRVSLFFSTKKYILPNILYVEMKYQDELIHVRTFQYALTSFKDKTLKLGQVLLQRLIHDHEKSEQYN